MLTERNICQRMNKSFNQRLAATRDFNGNRNDIETGMIMGWFLSEMGWLADSLQILDKVFQIGEFFPKNFNQWFSGIN